MRNFDFEEITLNGAELRKLLRETTRFGIDNYQKLEKDCVKAQDKTPLMAPLSHTWPLVAALGYQNKNWNYHNAFFFAGTLATTIGYGNFTPVTEKGKYFCLFFIMVGIPYFGYMMSAISDCITANLINFRFKIENYFNIEVG